MKFGKPRVQRVIWVSLHPIFGGDADTLAAIAGPMAYAFYREMPDSLVYAALKKLPDWMISVNERFDKRITEIHAE